MTKAQKEEKARNERKLQQMIAAGIKVGPADEEGETEKKKPADRKKGGRKAAEKVGALAFCRSCGTREPTHVLT